MTKNKFNKKKPELNLTSNYLRINKMRIRTWEAKKWLVSSRQDLRIGKPYTWNDKLSKIENTYIKREAERRERITQFDWVTYADESVDNSWKRSWTKEMLKPVKRNGNNVDHMVFYIIMVAFIVLAAFCLVKIIQFIH